MDSLIVIAWGAAATLVNIGVGRWCRAHDHRADGVAQLVRTGPDQGRR